jgi:hypothetical protein
LIPPKLFILPRPGVIDGELSYILKVSPDLAIRAGQRDRISIAGLRRFALGAEELVTIWEEFLPGGMFSVPVPFFALPRWRISNVVYYKIKITFKSKILEIFVKISHNLKLNLETN